MSLEFRLNLLVDVTSVIWVNTWNSQIFHQSVVILEVVLNYSVKISAIV